jgi:prepilin-type N-terminal cleavage/methylation domain-containing protein
LRGFTLVELLVTIGLLLTLTLIVTITYFASSPMTLLRGAAEQVAGDVRLARDLAVSEHARYRLAFAAGSASYSLQKRITASGTWEDATGTHQVRSLPDGARIQSVGDLDGGFVIFDSLGAPYEGAGMGTALVGSGAGGVDHIVIVSDDAGKTVDVTVSPGSGRVETLL